MKHLSRNTESHKSMKILTLEIFRLHDSTITCVGTSACDQLAITQGHEGTKEIISILATSVRHRLASYI